MQTEHYRVHASLEDILACADRDLVYHTTKYATFSCPNKQEQVLVAVCVLFASSVEIPYVVPLLGCPVEQLRAANPHELG